MEFEYYTDEIVLNNEMINNEVEVAPLDSFIFSAKNFLKKMGINSQNTTFFYKRNNKRASALGIQLFEGDNEDLTNYLVFDCIPFVHGREVFCNIDMHASSKISSRGMKFANLASEDVNGFFNMMEKYLILNGENDIELDYMKSNSLEKKKQSVFSKIIRRKY